MSILDIPAQIKNKNKEDNTGSLPVVNILKKFGPPISNETWLKFFDLIFKNRIPSLNKDDFVLLYVISDYLSYLEECKNTSSLTLEELEKYINSHYTSSSTLAIAGYLSGLIKNNTHAYEYSQNRTGEYNSRISFNDMINDTCWNKRKR